MTYFICWVFFVALWSFYSYKPSFLSKLLAAPLPKHGCISDSFHNHSMRLEACLLFRLLEAVNRFLLPPCGLLFPPLLACGRECEEIRLQVCQKATLHVWASLPVCCSSGGMSIAFNSLAPVATFHPYLTWLDHTREPMGSAR